MLKYYKIFLTFFLVSLQKNNAFARTSLGIGVNEGSLENHNFFSTFFAKIHVWQIYFERLMSNNLLNFNQNSSDAFWLILIAFIYGILHSIGPGHGKMVISSYILANKTTLKRGIFISFFASILQALTAICIISIVFFLLPVSWTKAAFWISNLSFFLIMILGIYMLYRSTTRLKKIYLQEKEEENCTCGHKHIIPSKDLENDFNLKTALYAILAIGLRPCSGALLIMSFAMINKMYFAGILSVLFMAFGTFITISSLAFLATYTKKLAQNYLSKSNKYNKILIIIEFCFSFFLFLLGLTLAISSFY